MKGEKGEEKLTAKHVIVATGARARDLPFAQADGKRVWTYRHAMTPAEMPSKLLVIGSGAIGIEFASFYNDMGAEVTVVEMLDRIVPVEDADVSAFLEKSLTKQGMTIMTGAGVEALAVSAQGREGQDQGQGRQGRRERVQPRHRRGRHRAQHREHRAREARPRWTAASSRSIPTAAPSRRACGRSATARPGPWLAHKASHEGVTAAEAIAQELGNKDVHPHPLDRNNIPGCTYCHPQVASVGLTEAKAKEAGYEVKAGTFPFIGNGKAIALGEAEGFIKTVFDAKTGELLGAHMIGAEVTELIQGYIVGKTLETTEAELMDTIFPHPTLSEMMHESVLAAYGRALHI